MKIKHNLSLRTLQHIVSWADVLKRDRNWTASDQKVYTVLKKEIKDFLHDRYIHEQAVRINPYLDPDQPYHTT